MEIMNEVANWIYWIFLLWFFYTKSIALFYTKTFAFSNQFSFDTKNCAFLQHIFTRYFITLLFLIFLRQQNIHSAWRLIVSLVVFLDANFRNFRINRIEKSPGTVLLILRTPNWSRTWNYFRWVSQLLGQLLPFRHARVLVLKPVSHVLLFLLFTSNYYLVGYQLR